jgi:ABC-type glycerol-3-phosphate transport system substrate-binding protein
MNNGRMSRRGFLRLLGVTAGTAALAACAPAGQVPGATTGQEAAAPVSQEAVTLRYRTWHAAGSSEGDAAWYDWLVENYAEESGGTQVEYEFVPFGAEYIQKVLADSASATPPDLLHSSIIWAREFYDRGVLLELDDYLATVPELAPENFYGDATTEYRSKNGRFYGVPWEGPDSSVIAVNSDFLEEAGFDRRGEDIQTWDDFLEAANAMTVRENGEITRAGYLATNFRSIETFSSWLQGNGGALHTRDFTEATFNNDRAVQVLEFHRSLYTEHEVSFPISPDLQPAQLFMQGQAAMIQAGTWSSAQYATQAPEGFDYWYILFPQGPQGSSMSCTTWSNMFVLPSATRTPDQAFDLMQYCTTPPVVLTRFQLSTRTTPHRSVFETETWQEVLNVAPARAVTIPAAEAGGVYPFFPFFTEANDAIGIELEQVMTAGRDIQEALDAADENVAEVIARRANA